MNVVTLRPVAGGEARFVEVQGTAEGKAFTRAELDDAARAGRARPGRDRRPAGRDWCRSHRHAAVIDAPPASAGVRDRQPGQGGRTAPILGADVELLPRPTTVPDVVEDAGTLVGNARLKAAAVAAATGLPAVADDTGLEVDALGGAPGVDTASFAGRRRHRRAQLVQAARRAWRAQPTTAGLGSAPSPWWCGPTVDEVQRRGDVRRRDRPEPRGATAASAMTVSSCRRRATAARSPR